MTILSVSIQLTDEQERLVIDHVGWAKNVAGQAARSLPIDFDEAVGVGNEGLVQAALRYDPAQGEFKTYAYRRIRGAIIDHCRKDAFVGRKGLERGEKVTMVSVNETNDFGEAIVQIAAIDSDPDLRIDFENALKKLTDREQKVVLSIATGIRGTELAVELGVTESRVSQIATEAKKKLLKGMTL